ncbi:hypothetical protein HK096_001687, partial [Nowakowskiella sp. JEL0078]
MPHGDSTTPTHGGELVIRNPQDPLSIPPQPPTPPQPMNFNTMVYNPFSQNMFFPQTTVQQSGGQILDPQVLVRAQMFQALATQNQQQNVATAALMGNSLLHFAAMQQIMRPGNVGSVPMGPINQLGPMQMGQMSQLGQMGQMGQYGQFGFGQGQSGNQGGSQDLGSWMGSGQWGQ